MLRLLLMQLQHRIKYIQHNNNFVLFLNNKNVLNDPFHVLNKQEEELLAAASDCLDAPSAIHNIMTNADMKFGNIKDEDGEVVELTEGNYSSFIKYMWFFF